MKKNLALLIVCVFAIALLLAGCGSGGNSGKDSASSDAKVKVSMDALFDKYDIDPDDVSYDEPYKMSTKKKYTKAELEKLLEELKNESDLSYKDVYRKFGCDPNEAAFGEDGLRALRWRAKDTRGLVGIIFHEVDGEWVYFMWNSTL